MLVEIDAAVQFVGRLLSASSKTVNDVADFKSKLAELMQEKFKDHWHTDSPGKGQGYRSIRIHPSEPLDPLLREAAVECRFSVTYFQIPVEFTLWVDPKEVSCRFGDVKPTYCTVLKDADNKSASINVGELLDAAKALYSRQQHFVVSDHAPGQNDVPQQMVNSSADAYNYGPSSGSSPPNGYHMYGYVDGYLPPPAHLMYPPRMVDNTGMDGSPNLPQASFTSTAVNTTPRKAKNAAATFRGKGNGRVGSGGSKHHHHHHHHHHHSADFGHHNGSGGGHHSRNHSASPSPTSNGNITNGSSNSSSGSGSNGTSSTNGGGGWNGTDRFHWVRGSKGQSSASSSGGGKEK